jgi:L-threonylcarbamoyladenylate synthase
MTARVVPDGEAGRAEAVAVLRAGGVIALPTDTVYGLGVALPTPGGIERLFHVKRRPPERGIVLLLADPAQMSELAIVTPAAEALAAALWPGGLTLILEQRPDVTLPAVLTGGATTIGLRVPDHDAPRALARALGPLPVTSANVSGQPEAPDAPAILGQLGDAIDLILDGGPATGGPASTVVDVTGERIRILRPGAVSPDRLGAVLEVAGLPSDVAG